MEATTNSAGPSNTDALKVRGDTHTQKRTMSSSNTMPVEETARCAADLARDEYGERVSRVFDRAGSYGVRRHGKKDASDQTVRAFDPRAASSSYDHQTAMLRLGPALRVDEMVRDERRSIAEPPSAADIHFLLRPPRLIDDAVGLNAAQIEMYAGASIIRSDRKVMQMGTCVVNVRSLRDATAPWARCAADLARDEYGALYSRVSRYNRCEPSIGCDDWNDTRETLVAVRTEKHFTVDERHGEVCCAADLACDD